MNSPSLSSAVLLSLKVGLWCAAAGLPFALLLGWLFARRDFRGKSVLGTLIFAPLVLPPVVTGFILLEIFGHERPVGLFLAKLGLSIPFSFSALVLAAAVVGFPIYFMMVRGAIEAVDLRYEEVAQTLGFKPSHTFLKITLPLALPGIFAGAVLAFARALGEFGATVVLAGNMEGKTRTLALAVYSLLEAPGGEELSWNFLYVSLAFAFAALLGYDLFSRWQRKRLEVQP